MMVLYSFVYSQHSRRVVSLLEETGIEYENRVVDMVNGEHRSPKYLAINPNHQVPTLIDGSVVLHESNTILRYVCQKYQLDNWYPSSLETRAEVDQWLDWNQSRLGDATISIVFNQLFAGDKADLAAIDRGLTKLQELSDILGNALERKSYLVGESPTIADLSLASNIFHLGLAEAMPDNENITKWYDNIAQLQGFQKSLPSQ